ncbi:MAG: hypothetical protein ABH829_05345 [archaeon]
MLRKTYGLIMELIREPEKAVKYSKESVHVPLLIWILASIFLLLPSAFIIPVIYMPNWTLILPSVIFMGFISLGGFWVYSWAVLVVAAKVAGYKEEPRQIFKIVGYSFGPMLFVSVATTVVASFVYLMGYNLANFVIFFGSIILGFIGYLYVLAHSMKKMYGDETLFVIYFALTLVLLFLR